VADATGQPLPRVSLQRGVHGSTVGATGTASCGVTVLVTATYNVLAKQVQSKYIYIYILDACCTWQCGVCKVQCTYHEYVF
jgi:hypothetical protein